MEDREREKGGKERHAGVKKEGNAQCYIYEDRVKLAPKK
jgi:hypothetical protein